jgi:flagellin
MDSLFTQTVQSRAGQKSRRNIPMRIQHNIMALNASNRLKSNDNAISKNIAKLSSGYRINNAADDAAGLAVSEKMRAQINGLNQAQSNAENGISLVQTAEGGLNETEAILQRMNTLAVESANGTYQDGTDRANLNKEITALQKEIDRISTSTNFNQINLLDGSLVKNTYTAAADASIATATIAGGTLKANDGVTVSVDDAGTATTAVAITGLMADHYDVVGPDSVEAGANTYTVTVKANTDTTDDEKAIIGDGLTFTFTTTEDFTLPTADTTDIAVKVGTVTEGKGALTLQIGSENDNNQRVSLSIADMSAKGLGVDGVSIANQEDAQNAITTIKDAINTVSATRADLGALQNRLEHTTNNLSTMSENLTSAESNIRDVDMSDEYVQYSKNQILSQAATAMLTQANAQPQNVLSLLKG